MITNYIIPVVYLM